MRPALLIGFVAAVNSVAFTAEPEPVHEIRISADIPTVTVAPRPAGRTSVRLPSLTYALTVTVECGANWQPDSVTINIADSRTSFNAEQLQADTELKLELRVPSNQIAPLRIEQFCVNDENEKPDTADQNIIMIPAVMSAQASLRCATESAQSIMYVTKPLDVMLECAMPVEDMESVRLD